MAAYAKHVSFDIRVTVPAEDLADVARALDDLFNPATEWDFEFLVGEPTLPGSDLV